MDKAGSHQARAAALAAKVEEAFDALLPPPSARPNIIHEAMHYSLRAGGKRLRPVLLLAAADMCHAPLSATPAAVAIECLHTYSLIHDDLPCVDNSALRRGRPTSHVRFGEAVALLAGDALLTEAFRIIGCSYEGHPRVAQRLTAILGMAASSTRLIGGQVEDILGEGRQISREDLDFIHNNKTAALIEASLEMGLAHCEHDEADLAAIRHAGRAMGLAFQIVDDILDATSSAEVLGKSAGQDAERGKNTYVKLHGLEASRKAAQALCADAADSFSRWGENGIFLRETALSLAERGR
jgi:geranylgeranyl pyrophosphate synthase